MATLPLVAAGLSGVALAILVGADGSMLWRSVRVVVVGAVTVTAVRTDVRWQRHAQFLLALVATAAGVGIGLPHVVKTGLSIRAAAGLAALVAGLLLLVAGAVRLWARLRSWRRLLVIPVALVMLVFVLAPLSIAIAATNVPRTSIGSRTPADLGMAYDDVVLQTSDGVDLAGWYVPSENGAAVVLLHGAGSTRSATLDHAAVLARHGYGVVLLDARGHGESGGRAMDFGWYGDDDVAAVVTFLERQPEIDPQRIGAVGLSMGGEEAVGAAAALPGIRAVVAEGATGRTAADKAWMSDVYGVRGWVQERIEWMTFSLTDLLTAADPPIALHDAVAVAAPRPVLLIAAGNVSDEADAARFIGSASPTTVEIWQVPDTGHTDGLTTHPEEWEARVTTFLAEHLGP
ncbi:MAG: alpha/beta hydrolase [Acidimicrobiia bacterium]